MPGETADSEKDAFRHLLTPARFMYFHHFPAFVVETFRQNEKMNGDKNFSGIVSLRMDHWNNELGLALGVAARLIRETDYAELPDEGVMNLIFADIAAELIHLNVGIRRTDPYPYHPHGRVDYERLYAPTHRRTNTDGEESQDLYSRPLDADNTASSLKDWVDMVNYFHFLIMNRIEFGIRPPYPRRGDDSTFYDPNREPRRQISEGLQEYLREDLNK